MRGKVGEFDLDPAVWSLRPSAEKVTMGFGTGLGKRVAKGKVRLQKDLHPRREIQPGHP